MVCPLLLVEQIICHPAAHDAFLWRSGIDMLSFYIAVVYCIAQYVCVSDILLPDIQLHHTEGSGYVCIVACHVYAIDGLVARHLLVGYICHICSLAVLSQQVDGVV